MSLVQFAPRISSADAVNLAQSKFGVIGNATPLPSERDQNFKIETATGEQFVLKIATH